MPEVEIPSAFKGLFEKHRIKCYYGGRGAGKSQSVAMWLLGEGMAEKQNILCCREYQVSIKESVKSLLDSLIEEMDLGWFYTSLQTEIRGKNGSRIFFAGIKNNIANIKSMHDIKKCWIEEGQVISENSINILLPTIRSEGSEIIITMNPILEDDPAYQRFVLYPSEDSVVRMVNYSDNKFFPLVLENERLDLLRRNPELYKNVWEGQCLLAVEGAIFAKEIENASKRTEEYPDSRITKVPYDKTKPVDVFYDLGRGDKTAMWFVQQIGYEYRFINYYENNGEHFSHYIKIAKDLGYVYGRHYLPHDAENENIAAIKTIKQQAIDAFGSGIIVIPRISKKALAIDAARGVADMCVWDRTNCADGLTCLRKYAYKVDPDTGKTSREPEHDTPWSHGCLVAGTMIATKFGEKPIEDIKIGDKVYTPNGLRRVLNSGMTKISSKLITIYTIHGPITATPEHKIFTSLGVLRADALCANIIIWNKKDHLQLPSTMSCTGYRDAIMSLLPVQEKRIATYTGQSGSKRMARYLKAITFIIKTETALTMRLRTLGVYLNMNICLTMLKLTNGIRAERMSRFFLQRLCQQQEHGTLVKQDSSGTVNMAKEHGLIGKHLRRIVSSVGRNMKHTTHSNQSIAQIVVGTREEEKSLPVYDLTVEDDHCYYANGILVSNSDAWMAVGQSLLKTRVKKPKAKKSIYSGMPR